MIRVMRHINRFISGWLTEALDLGGMANIETADVAVVFGAGVLPDGTPSHALLDRVHTACDLYLRGFVHKLIFSGGPGRAIVSEPEVMKRVACERGIPSEDIILDPDGHNTRKTVQNTVSIFHRSGMKRILAVSHFYHLPRIRMAYSQVGLSIRTVAAREQYGLTHLPWYLIREVVAFAYYYLHPI